MKVVLMYCLNPSACSLLFRFLCLTLLLGVGLIAVSFSAANTFARSHSFDPPDGFEVVEILDGLDSPAGFAFSPDGRMFICERITGALLVAEFNASSQAWELSPTPFYTFDIPKDSGVPARHRSSGLRDIAFDPDFESNGWIYAFYMDNSPRQNRVVRVKASAADPNLAEPGSEELLIELPYNTSASSGSHNGGAIEFGVDGTLYITTGDGWNGGDVVQSLSTFTGKVVRINADGTIPEDNPFYDQANGSYRAIYALGLRNPYSISRHPDSGVLYINEAGGDKKASIFIVEPGANYGHQGYNGIGIQKQEWGNGATGASGSLITGGAWYPSDGYWPNQYKGGYFTALWGGNGDAIGHINYLQGQNNPSISAFSTSVGQSGLKPVLTRIGPDQNLYYALTNYESDQGRIQMIRWTGQESVASPVLDPPAGSYSNPVEATLSSSTPEAQIRYTVDGSSPDSESAVYETPLLISESTVLTARAYKEGLLPSGISSAIYTIGEATNIPPVANAGEDQLATVGDFVTLSGAGSFDPDGDDLTLSWQWTQLSGPDVDLFSAEDAVAFFTPQEEGRYVFQISVIDAQDTSTDEVEINVQAELPLDAGLIGYWLLDEENGLSAQDEINMQGGTLLNGPVWRPGEGKIGGALEFDGLDDYVDLGTMDDVSGLGLTVAFWFNADDFEIHDARFISKASGVQDEDHYWMVSTLNETAVRFRLKAGGTTSTLISGEGAVTLNTWHHLAATYNGSQMHLYVDGSRVASQDKSGQIDTNASVLAVLGNQTPGAGDRPFDGLIDDVRVYNRALGSNSISILASGEIALDLPDVIPTPRTPSISNYPNPFSRSSTIRYNLEQTGPVRLEVFDMTGRRVALLVDEVKAAGAHEVHFDAIELPSNIYLSRLITKGSSTTKLLHVLR